MRCFLGLHNWNLYVSHNWPFRRCIHCTRMEKAVTDYAEGETYWRPTVFDRP